MTDLPLSQFRPTPKLVVPSSGITAPFRKIIDAHNHLGQFGGNWDKRTPEEFFAHLDRTEVVHYVDLDGGWGEDILEDRLRRFKAFAPERYRVFGGVDWGKWAEEGHAFADKCAARFRAQVARGAQGLKIWKPFGLNITDDKGVLAKIDDPRLDAIWAAAGELHLPVLIHIADPVAFFDPVGATNERWEELGGHPEWSFPSPPFPSFSNLIEAFANLIRRHPNTTFIGAHVGCYSENLGWVSALLDECPNFMVDISARIGELGRQPYSARKFFLKHPDRILFGTDVGPDIASYGIYARFLESEDEYFNYGTGDVPGQGRWQIYGLNLPRPVLDQIYYENAARLFGL